MNDLADPQRYNIPSALGVETVADMRGLRALKADWDRLLARDPEAGVFLSHAWLAPSFEANPDRWRVFVVRDGGGRAICIFPTKNRVHWSTTRKQFQTELEEGGRLAWGEYNGFICDPEWEGEALGALARALARLPWKALSLRYEPTERRAKIFAEALGPAFTYQFRDYRINKGTVDNLLSLQVPLASGFETLMTERLSANTRQKIRRHRRKLIESGTYRITTSDGGDIENDIARLLRNWVAKWSETKGRDKALRIAERYGRALLTAGAMDRLYLPVLWQDDRMLGALGHIVDTGRGSVHFLVAGRDPNATDPAIGLLLHAHAIEWAAGAGFKTYDFGHGDEAYKTSFGPEYVRTHYLEVRRTGSAEVLDPVSLKPALRRLGQFVRAKQTDRVLEGAAQLAALIDDADRTGPF
ncbi:GNAT family N-acetyltransferase [Marimonas sp. MJW-29]|uniref:GNAT family N-acetyltransferase n=1 Tax=Sulfitobacter sediminis TaxID=3234186 RepID=A0ABV3RML8_9RHOB